MKDGNIERDKITVSMPLSEFEYYQDAVEGRKLLLDMMRRANKDGTSAVMTDELKTFIEEIYQ